MRTKQERMKNAESKSRGNCIELYAIMSPDDAIARGAGLVLVKVAGHEEGCRDADDVRAVMVEKDIVGVIKPMRRVCDNIERAMKMVAGFVTPTNTNDSGEVE